nr:hypothetical protein [Paracoccus saliphilus]
MSYDPNDPNRPKTGTRDHKETYVEPVERRSSALPLIIGVLLALALAYFVLQRFMADDTVAVEGDTTTVITTEPEIADPADTVVVTEPVEEPAVEVEADAVEVEETATVPATDDTLVAEPEIVEEPATDDTLVAEPEIAEEPAVDPIATEPAPTGTLTTDAPATEEEIPAEPTTTPLPDEAEEIEPAPLN